MPTLPFLFGFHAKDGVYAQGFNPKGEGVQIGHGSVDFEGLFKKLLATGYRGPFTIEQEIPLGPERDRQLAEETVYLEDMLEKLDAALSANID